MLLKTSLPLLIGVTFALSFSLQAQSLKFSDVYVSAGINWTHGTGTLQDFKKLAPNSKFINEDFTGFSSSNDFQYGQINGDGRASFLVGLDILKNGESRNGAPQLRIGLTYSSGSSLSYSVYDENTSLFDTLTSSRTGNETYIDSVFNEGYGFGYNSENLLLDVSLLFRSNPESRWSVYGGVGIAGGISLNSTTNTHHYQNYYLKSRDNEYISSYEYDNDYGSSFETETFRNENSFMVSGYIPLGVDFRIGKSKEFWKRTHLFAELRPAVNMNFIPELGTYTQTSFSHSIGIRIS